VTVGGVPGSSDQPTAHFRVLPAIFSWCSRTWDSSFGSTLIPKVAVPGVGIPASYVRAGELRQVVSIWSSVVSIPSMLVGQPTVIRVPSSGSIAERSVPCVFTAILVSFQRWDVPPHGGVSDRLTAAVSACAQTESGAAFYEELGGKADAPQTGGGLVVLTVPCDDVVEVTLDRVPQGCGDGSGAAH